jgi:hypothetical protein
MPAFLVPAIMAGVSALQGYLANRSKKQQETEQAGTSSGTQNTTQTINTSSSTMPQYDPKQLQMRDFLMSQMYNRTNPNQIQGLVENYVGQGTNNINASAGQNEQALSAALAARGLSYSPVAGQAIGQAQNQRIGDIIGLRNQAPLLQDQIQQQRLTDFSTFMRGLPTGTSTTGSSTGTTTGTTTGATQGTGSVSDPNVNPWTGALGTLSSTLANLYGQGAFSGGGGNGTTNRRRPAAQTPGGAYAGLGTLN